MSLLIPARFDSEIGSYRPEDFGLSEPRQSLATSIIIAVWTVIEAVFVISSPLLIVVGFGALLGVI